MTFWKLTVPQGGACRHSLQATPNLPTKIVPTKIRWLKTSGEFPMDMIISPLNMKILLQSNPLKSRILVRRLAVVTSQPTAQKPRIRDSSGQNRDADGSLWRQADYRGHRDSTNATSAIDKQTTEVTMPPTIRDRKMALDWGVHRPRHYVLCNWCWQFRGFDYKLKWGAGL